MPDRYGMPHRGPGEDNLPYGVTSRDIDEHFGGHEECPNDLCEDGKVTCTKCGGDGCPSGSQPVVEELDKLIARLKDELQDDVPGDWPEVKKGDIRTLVKARTWIVCEECDGEGRVDCDECEGEGVV